MKRKIALMLSLLMMTQSAYAASSVNEPSYDNGILTVTGTADKANMPVKLEIFNKGVEYSEAGNVTADNISDIFMSMYQMNAAADGSFSFEVPVDAERGNYLIRIGFFGGEVVEKSYATYTEEELNTAINDFIANPDKNADELKQLIEDYYSGLGVNYTDLKSLSDDEATLAYTNIASQITSEFTKTDFITAINTEIAVRQISKNPSIKLVESYALVLGFKDTLYYQEYTKLSDEEKEAVTQKLKGASDAAAIDNILKNSVILGEISNSLWNEVYSVLKKYNSYIGLNFTNLDGIPENSESRKNIMSDLKDSVKNGVITDISMLQSEIEALVKKYPYIPVTSVGGGSTGGGGGGGGGSISAKPNTNPVVSDNKNVYTSAVSQTVTNNRIFEDIASYSWAEEAIEKLYERGIIKGKSDKLFDPSGNVTREEFIAMIVRGFGLKSNDEISEFSDVSAERWSSEYIRAAVSNGIVTGYENGKFAPGANITRQDMAVIASRTVDACGMELLEDGFTMFDDYNKISEYAKDSVEALASAGIINGKDGEFVPHGITSRAEAAVVIHRILKACGKI